MRYSESQESPFVCDICGKHMPLKEIGGHEREAHQDLIDLRERLARRQFRPFAALVISGGIVFIAGVLLVGYLPQKWIEESVIGLLAFLMAIVGLAAWQSDKAMQPYRDALLRVVVECEICGKSMTKAEWIEHNKTVHPEMLQATKRGMALVAVIATVLTLLGSFAIWGYVAKPNRMFAAALVSIFSLTAALLLVGIYWFPRQERKSKVSKDISYRGPRIP